MAILAMTASFSSSASASAHLRVVMAMRAEGISIAALSANLRLLSGVRVYAVSVQADAASREARAYTIGTQVEAVSREARAYATGVQAEAVSREARTYGLGLNVEAVSRELRVYLVGLLADIFMEKRVMSYPALDVINLDKSGQFKQILENAYDVSFYAQLSGLGSFRFRLPREDPKSASLSAGDIIEFRVRAIPAFWGIVEEIAEDIAAEPQVVEVSGRGILARLEKALVYPDASGKADRDFPSGTIGSIFLTLLLEFETRGGGLPFIWDFSADYDSAGQPWGQTWAVRYRAGMTLKDVLEHLAGLGAEFYFDPVGKRLRLFKKAGANRSEGIAFFEGKNLLRLRRRRSILDTVSAVLAVGPERTVERSVSFPIRMEGTLPFGVGMDETTVQNAADAALARHGRVLEGLEVEAVAEPCPFIDYGLGDTVTVSASGLMGTFRVQGISIDAREEGWRVGLDLEDAALDAIARLYRSLKAAARYAIPTGTSASPLAREDARDKALRDEVVLKGSSAGGDLAGTYPNPTVWRIRGRPVSDAAPNANDVLTWDAAQGMWKPAPPPAGGGGGGSGNAGPWTLLDLYSPNFPTTSMFPVSVGYANVTFENEGGGRGVLFLRTGNSGGNGFAMRLRTISPPVRVICGFTDWSWRTGDRDVAIVVYNQNNGRLIVFTSYRLGLDASRWNSYSSWASNIFNHQETRYRDHLIEFELLGSGFNAYAHLGYGKRWLVFSESYSNFIGAVTHVGIAAGCFSPTWASGWFWHWEEIAV